MLSRSVYKVPHGKLLKISVDFNEKNGTIKNIKITGDFFAYPEESIELMEHQLKNTTLERDQLLKKIRSIIEGNKIEFIGLDAEGLTEGILLCKP